MAFCTNCGREIPEGAKFCQTCGHAVSASDASEKQREIEFSGRIYKCPNCGEVLKSFMTNCPSCGFELRDAKATSSVKEFALKLEAIENQRVINNNKKSSFIAKIWGSDGTLTGTDEQKISLIRSFSVPNTKEDVLEFMILASSNIDTSIYDMFRNYTISDEPRRAISDAWIAKTEQVYEKAKLTFGNTPEFQNIEKMYLKKIMEVKIKKQVPLLLFIGMWGFIIFFYILVM